MMSSLSSTISRVLVASSTRSTPMRCIALAVRRPTALLLMARSRRQEFSTTPSRSTSYDNSGTSNDNATLTLDGRAAVPATTCKLPADPRLQVTSSAVAKLRAVQAQSNTDGEPASYLRVGIDSGGCHGYQYQFEIVHDVNEDDIIFTVDTLAKDNNTANQDVTVSLLVDAISYPYLAGAQIDYVDELIGSSFKVAQNPNAQSECGCKISFQAK